MVRNMSAHSIKAKRKRRCNAKVDRQAIALRLSQMNINGNFAINGTVERLKFVVITLVIVNNTEEWSRARAKVRTEVYR